MEHILERKKIPTNMMVTKEYIDLIDRFEQKHQDFQGMEFKEEIRMLLRLSTTLLDSFSIQELQELAKKRKSQEILPVEVKNASKVGNFYMFAFVFEGFCHDSSRILKFLILDEFGHCHRGVILFNIDGISWISERFSGVTESLPVFSAEAI